MAIYVFIFLHEFSRIKHEFVILLFVYYSRQLVEEFKRKYISLTKTSCFAK